MTTQTLTRLKKARAKMLIKHPFFATLMMSMPMVETTEIPTAATDMKSLFVNPEFIETLTDDVILFVLGHEIMHTALEHGLRRQTRDPMRWNIAADYSINMTLKDCGFTVWDQALHDEKYRDPTSKLPMSADHIYNLLTKEQDQDGGGKGPQGQPGQPGQGQPGGKHHSPMLGDLKDPGTGNDPAAEERIRKDIQQRVAQAATIARMTGNMSGGLERFVQGILDPKVPWQEMLRHYMHKVKQDEENWSRRNRRFADFFLPARHNERMGEIVLIGDTSGSIGNDELKQYMTEAAAIVEAVKPERVRILWADTKVAGEQLFEDGEEIVPKPKGGGGTDMRVPLSHAETFEPEVVVLFTDGYTPWPAAETPYPLIVCCTTSAKVPVGQEVRI
jgi:predicted metal-dependent peptidase